MSRRLPDVVFMQPSEPGGIRSGCRRCGEVLALRLPLPISEVALLMRRFIRRHRPCQQAQAAEDRGEA